MSRRTMRKIEPSENGSRPERTALPDFALRCDPWGRLVYTDAVGTEHVGVELVRAFPITHPDSGIALCDSAGRELLWIEDVTLLPDPVQHLIQLDLARGSFLPVLKRILSVSNPVEPTEWEVETDRGQTRFILNSDEDVHRLDGWRALVIDAHGMRYLIPDTRALDAASRRILERYL